MEKRGPNCPARASSTNMQRYRWRRRCTGAGLDWRGGCYTQRYGDLSIRGWSAAFRQRDWRRRGHWCVL